MFVCTWAHAQVAILSMVRIGLFEKMALEQWPKGRDRELGQRP